MMPRGLVALAFGAILIGADKPEVASPAPVKPVPQVEVHASPPVLTNYFRKDAPAAAQVEGAIAEAKAGGRQAILVFGADWCSDSTALAAVLKSDFFQAYLGDRYSVTLVDVNLPTRGDGRNQDIVQRLGIDKMTGTPEVLVIGKDGKPINTIEDAHSWRNAGDRPFLSIVRYFRDLKSEPVKPN